MYARAIEGMEFDGLFGPAYKGIPLVQRYRWLWPSKAVMCR